MKYILLLSILIGSNAFGQISTDSLRKFVRESKMSTYSYHMQFVGHKNYAAPYIQTSDGGGAVFGDYTDENEKRYGLLIKLNKEGKEEWRKEILPKYDEIECQSVLEDSNGNLYVFMLSYNYKLYRGGTERVICYDKSGKLMWDKEMGKYSTENNPMFSYIKMDKGEIKLKGHIVIEKAKSGEDPVYHYWEGKLDFKGNLTQSHAQKIDWKNDKWQDWYKPEE